MNLIIIACVDEHSGMMFNDRRQSQDHVLQEQILHETQNNWLWMNPYSFKPFSKMKAENIVVDEDFLDKAALHDYCFVENVNVYPYQDKIHRVILYKWNRTYPADFYFDLPLVAHQWSLVDTVDYKGHSHDKITKEIYEKCIK